MDTVGDVVTSSSVVPLCVCASVVVRTSVLLVGVLWGWVNKVVVAVVVVVGLGEVVTPTVAVSSCRSVMSVGLTLPVTGLWV